MMIPAMMNPTMLGMRIFLQIIGTKRMTVRIRAIMANGLVIMA